MEYITIPGIEQKTSRIGLGTWALGGWMWGGTKKNKPTETILSALDHKINLIDTAPAYGFGKAEELIGNTFDRYGNRDEIILSTKVGIEWDKEKNVKRNCTPERIFKEIYDSLDRLSTDYIDIYHVHWPDPLVPIENTAKAMKNLYIEGKINAIGVSNFSVQQMEKFRKVAPIHTCQPPYNLFEREIEERIICYCQENNIALITYSSLCRGLLTGKMSKDREFNGDDLRNIDPKFQSRHFTSYLNAVDRIASFLKEKYNKTILPGAIRWILDQQGTGVALWGARQPAQIEPVDDVFGWHLNKEDFKQIDNILTESIPEPVKSDFMGPPTRKEITI